MLNILYYKVHFWYWLENNTCFGSVSVTSKDKLRSFLGAKLFRKKEKKRKFINTRFILAY